MSPATYRLVVHTGPNPGTVFELARDVASVGRDVTNEIVLGDAEISRQHAHFTRTPAGYVIEDLGSTNGTFVNGQRLGGPVVLKPGDVVSFGEQIVLLYDAINMDPGATMAASRKTVRPSPVAPAAVAPSPAPAYAPPPVVPATQKSNP